MGEVSLSQRKRVIAAQVLSRCDGCQASSEALEGVMPERLPCERIKAEDLTAARSKDGPGLQDGIDEVQAFEPRRPHLPARPLLQGDDRAFDADIHQVWGFHRFVVIRLKLTLLVRFSHYKSIGHLY